MAEEVSEYNDRGIGFKGQLESRTSSTDLSKLASFAPHAIYVYTVLHSNPPPTKVLQTLEDQTVRCEYSTTKKSRILSSISSEVQGVGIGPSATKASCNAACDLLLKLYPHVDDLLEIMKRIDQKLSSSSCKLRPILPNTEPMFGSFVFEQDASVLLNEICQQMKSPFPEVVIHKTENHEYHVVMTVERGIEKISSEVCHAALKSAKKEASAQLLFKLLPEYSTLEQIKDYLCDCRKNIKNLKRVERKMKRESELEVMKQVVKEVEDVVSTCSETLSDQLPETVASEPVLEKEEFVVQHESIPEPQIADEQVPEPSLIQRVTFRGPVFAIPTGFWKNNRYYVYSPVFSHPFFVPSF